MADKTSPTPAPSKQRVWEQEDTLHYSKEEVLSGINWWHSLQSDMEGYGELPIWGLEAAGRDKPGPRVGSWKGVGS